MSTKSKTAKKEKAVIIHSARKGQEMVIYKPPSQPMVKYGKQQQRMSANKGGKIQNQTGTSVPNKINAFFKPYYTQTSKADGGKIVRGGDTIYIVQGIVNTFPGQQLVLLPISLLSGFLQNTKLYFDALWHEKYRFNKLRFIFEPDVGTSTNLSIIMFYDVDPSDPLPAPAPTTFQAGLQAVQIYMGYRDAIKGPVWSPVQLDCKISSDPQGFYYTNYVGGDPRLAFQGQFGIAAGAPISTTGQLGTIHMEYEIEFWDPSIDQVNSQVRFATTSVAGWTSTPNTLFNNLGNTALTATGNGGQNGNMTLGIDALGNSFINLFSGVYQVLSQWQNQLNATQINLPVLSLLSNIVGQQPLASVFTTEGTAGTPNVFNQSLANFKVSVPPGGGKLYGTMSSIVSTMGMLLKIGSWASAALL